MGRKKIDLTGQRFGKLVVIRDVGRENGHVLWECLCDCGEPRQIKSGNLRNGNSRSCGCMVCGNSDLKGQRFGKWTVVDECETRRWKQVCWVCVCECGTYKEVSGSSLRRGMSTSCGYCVRFEDIGGERFGKLVAVEVIERRKGQTYWLCKCDCGETSEVTLANLKSGDIKSCGCSQYSFGVDHHNYNPNLTEEERLKNRHRTNEVEFRVWSKMVKDRDNYTCQICNQHRGKLNSHHLNGWNAFPEQRFDLDNGVTLCTDCHKDFHSQYGYGDNTREQFDEYAASKTLVLN